MIRRRGLIDVARNRLPGEYQETEWIGSSGTQYIDTNRIPLETDFYELNLSRTNYGQQWAFGNNGGNGWSLEFGNTEPLWRSVGAGYYGAYECSINDFNIYKISRNNFLMNDISFSRSVTIPYKINPIKTIRLFGTSHNTSQDFYGSCKIAYYKCYSNNALIQHFIPCYRRSDGEIGMYDIVGKQFYTNQGTGTFTKGEEI